LLIVCRNTSYNEVRCALRRCGGIMPVTSHFHKSHKESLADDF